MFWFSNDPSGICGVSSHPSAISRATRPCFANAVVKELMRTGWKGAPIRVYEQMSKLAELGFLTIETGKAYRSVPGMKVNVVEAA